MDDVSSACLISLEEIAAARVLATRGRATALHGAKEKYTMHAEREVHDSFTGAVPLAQGGAGAGSAPASVPVPASVAASEFGENVELF
jgi:hypothetical protein